MLARLNSVRLIGQRSPEPIEAALQSKTAHLTQFSNPWAIAYRKYITIAARLMPLWGANAKRH